MESKSLFSTWQVFSLSSILGWVIASSLLDLTRRLRSLIQPWITRRVQSDTTLILHIQRCRHGYLDNLFSVLSCVVSVPFYTGFLPLLFWSGHSKLARQMTLLMAFCDYIGNSIKDMLSAPRPSCPPVRRVTATEDEKENAREYGLPSSHTLNTVCLSGYLLHYVTTCDPEGDGTKLFIGFSLVFILVLLISIGRIYLGMHSLIDVVAGFVLGLVILSFWLIVHGLIDDFIVSGQNVTYFWVGLSFLLFFAYPTPEFPTPSFEYHTAFNGVAFGIVSGIQQTYRHFHHESIPHLFSPQLTLPTFMGRVMLGIPTMLIVKSCIKAISKCLLPIFCNTLGIPVKSSCYVPALKEFDKSKNKSDGKIRSLALILQGRTYDIDTGIRFLQYAGLAWSVVDLVPSIFYHVNL
ncbi:uncharacterized protein A4U43_C08F9200 [Asparagus officinalis]|uniref:lipid phosphate phosphatase delta-like n=1 Tax=Asparagus officinalis TaxID=4686 RepID=UPI00098E27DD|nr:lipid phosphate phosphatase delta-like [Asparagus officinalis]ONK59680.1 uncharacterized protein A4U43_C08F9200 [Asparagus officinalis]